MLKQPQIIIGSFPGFKEAKEQFPDIKAENTVFSFGDKIYAPHPITEDLLAHETVHCNRQGFTEEGAKVWWDKYFSDAEFRLNEELIAYQAQYQFYRNHGLNREQLFRAGMNLAYYLSDERYGNLITKQEAYKRITNA